MKVENLICQFRAAFGFSTHRNGKDTVSVDPLLAKFRELGIRVASVSYTNPIGTGESRVLKIQLATGTGKNRTSRELRFNRDQELVYDQSSSLHLPGTEGRSSFRGHDPRRDTGDYFE